MTSSTNTRSTAVSFQQWGGFRNAKNERTVVNLWTKNCGLSRHEPLPVLNSMGDDSNSALKRSLAQERTDCIYALLVCDRSH
jgi:hypothetical protein